MTNTIRDIAEDAQSYFIIGSNTTEQHPVIGIKIRRAVRKRGAKLIVADPRRIDIAHDATLYLRHKPGTDVALLNGIMHVIVREGWQDKEFIAARTEGYEELEETVAKYTPEVVSAITGVPAEKIEEAARLLAENRPGALLYAMGITQHTSGVNNVISCSNLQTLLGNMGVPGGGVNPLRGQNNVQGACDMGGLPNVYPGYQSVAVHENQEKFEKAWGVPLPGKVGLTIVEIIGAACAGKLRAMYVVGENPVVSDPDSHHVMQCLMQLDLLVVQDIFLTETAQFADVVLPSTSFAEKTGTVTNTERRIQLTHRAINPVGLARPGWKIICNLAKRMMRPGVYEPDTDAPHWGWGYHSIADVMLEIKALTPIYGGVSHDRLEAGEQLHWPVPNDEHPGTPIMHVGKFSRGRGLFVGVDHLPSAELPDEEYPLMLTTGRVIYHWHGGEMTRRSNGLSEVYPEALIEVHPEDAMSAGFEDGDIIKVESRRGEIVAKAKVTERIQPGLIFATFHFPDSAANFLTIRALDPVSKIPEYKVCAVKIDST